MKKLLEAVNEIIPGLQDSLDNIISNLVEEVNHLHRGGYGLEGGTGRNFFAAIENEELPACLQFRLSTAVIENIDLIAAASPPEPGGDSADPGGEIEAGNGVNALEIARLRDKPFGDSTGESSATLMDRYRGIISSLGVDGRESGRMAQAFSQAESQFREHHLAATGVNLDEEMLNMIHYHHAWQAAANFINHVDRMLEIMFMQLAR